MNEQPQIGDRVKAVRFSWQAIIEDNDLVPLGTEGTVTYFDGAGGIHVMWDNGCRVALLPGYDQWEVIDARK